jgi:Haem-binding domain
MSWLVRADVESGRDELNFSDWEGDGERADNAAEAVADGEMPPRRYKLLHPEARLSDDEADQLIAALDAMNADRGESSGPGGGDDSDNSGPGGGGDDG